MTKCPQCGWVKLGGPGGNQLTFYTGDVQQTIGFSTRADAEKAKELVKLFTVHAEQRYQEALDAVLLTLGSNTCAMVEGPGVDWAIQIINSKLRQHSQECRICSKPQPCSEHGRTPVSFEDWDEIREDVAQQLKHSQEGEG